jgi:uncharacterized membrane protein (DUF485 family)
MAGGAGTEAGTRPGGTSGAAARGKRKQFNPRRGNMADVSQYDWKAIDNDPKFQELHRKKTMFLWGLMVFSMVYYFLLPIGAAYFQDLFKIKVWGPVNVGILFALSEFVVAWGLAWYYSHHANTVFDAEAAAIVQDVEKKYGGRK